MRLLKWLAGLAVLALNAFLPEHESNVQLAITGLEIAAIVGAGGSALSSLLGGKEQSPLVLGSKHTTKLAQGAGNETLRLLTQVLQGGASQFGGDLTQGLSGGEQQVQSALFGRGTAGGGGLFDTITKQLLEALTTGFNPQVLGDFREARQGQLQQDLDLNTSRVREGQAVRGSIFSTGGAEAENRSNERLIAAESAKGAELEAQLRGQAAQRQLQALPLAPSILQGTSDIGSLVRNIGQSDIDRRLAEFIRTAPESFLGLGGNVLGLGGGFIQQPSSNIFDSLAPLLASGAGLAGGMANNQALNAILQQILNPQGGSTGIGGGDLSGGSGTLETSGLAP